jgi:hypothetical protein
MLQERDALLAGEAANEAVAAADTLVVAAVAQMTETRSGTGYFSP